AWTDCSKPSTPPSPRARAWASPFAGRSSRRMEDGCGRLRTNLGGPCSSSLSLPLRTTPLPCPNSAVLFGRRQIMRGKETDHLQVTLFTPLSNGMISGQQRQHTILALRVNLTFALGESP